MDVRAIVELFSVTGERFANYVLLPQLKIGVAESDWIFSASDHLLAEKLGDLSVLREAWKK